MEKCFILFLSKWYCRVQIFLGLCLAMLFICFAPSINSAAQGHNYFEWGAYNGNSNPVTEISPYSLPLYSMIEQSFNSSITYLPSPWPNYVSYNNFINSLNNYGLGNLLSSWNPINPQYYLNIAYITGREQYGNINRGYALYFSKSNGSGRINTTINNDFIFFDSKNPIILDREFASVLYPIARIGSENNYDTYSSVSVYTTYGIGNTFLNRTNTFVSYNTNITSLITSYDNSSGNEYTKIIDDFNNYLNNDSIYTFIIYIPDTSSNWNLVCRTYSNCGYHSNVGDTYWLFSTINIYDYNSNLYSLNMSSSAYFSQIKFYYDVLSNSQIEDYSKILSIGYSQGSSSSYNTPTPIPSFSPITSPSPVPTFFVPVTITPITLPVNPIIDTSYGDPISYVMAMINMVGSVLSSNIVSFFSTVVSYMYNSSIFFEILMFVIPAIVLIAFVVGRLKRK